MSNQRKVGMGDLIHHMIISQINIDVIDLTWVRAIKKGSEQSEEYVTKTF